MSSIDKHAVQAVADLKAGYTLGHADVAILNELARIALASLEADKEYKHHSIIAEQLAHVLSSMDATDHQRAVISCAVDRLNNVSQLLQSSPSALLVPETLDYQGAKELYNYLMNEEETNATVNGWNACRAATLQSFGNSEQLNSTVIPDGWVACSERMPEVRKPVYIFHPDYGVDQCAWYDDKENAFTWDDEFRFRTLESVSHWMAMPALPAAPQQEVK
ncbi:DUF551 domain-containing protein [Enterobacter asburiae]|uniref:DUF551 domain-containing protein n=1 Tax=Enterobacter asburiae TaxID=61645 RepID=UPI002074D77E|nr:DUF551 domain-containing protein [Enterobacter asburiae]MCM7687637.1 DUF551 domain-containing protein [Enterobacter asburiae]